MHTVEFGYSYKNVGYFVLRIPLLSLEDFYDIVNYTDKNGSFSDFSLHNKLLYNKVKYAVLSSSYNLFNAQNTNPENKDIQRKMLYYAIRMSTRSAPYGTMSGVAFGIIKDLSKITFKRRNILVSMAPDMEIFINYLHRIQREENIIKKLILYRNPIFIKTLRSWINLNMNPENMNRDEIQSIKSTKAVDWILNNINQEGKPTKRILILAKTKFPDTKYKTILSSISKMLESGILFTDLMPDFIDTAERPLGQVIKTLKRHRIKEENTTSLIELYKETNIFQIHENMMISLLRKYEKIKDILNQLDLTDLQDETNILKVDSKYVLKGLSLSKKVSESINLAATLYIALNGSSTEFSLNEYKKDFKERYGEYTLVPFIELINPSLGLGLPRESTKPVITNNTKKYIGFAITALSQKKKYVELEDSDLDTSSLTKNPTSMSMFITLSSKSQEDVNNDRYKIIINDIQNYSDAISGISRFLYFDSKSNKLISEINRRVNKINKYIVEAEVLALPSPVRASNIIERKISSDYIIQFSLPCHTKKSTIPLEEIMVGMKNGSFYTEWSGTILRVKHSSMLKSDLLPNSISLLLNLSNDTKTKFYPNKALDYTKFLPEVRYKNIILNRAKWLINNKSNIDFQSLKSFNHSFDKFAKQMHIPKIISIVDHDNKLVLDLKYLSQKEELYKIIKKNISNGLDTIIQDSTIDIQSTPIVIHNKHFVNDLVVPVILEDDEEYNKWKKPLKNTQRENKVNKLKMPFDDWISIYIYMDENIANDFIVYELLGMIKRLKHHQGFKKWFFIRYKDTKFHIRIRINGNYKFLSGPALHLMHDWFIKLKNRKVTTKISLNTYEREIEKYRDSKGLEIAEEIFYIDSEISLKILEFMLNNPLSNPIIMVALSFDILIKDLGIPLKNRMELYANWSKNLHNYFNKNFHTDLGVLISLVTNPKDYSLKILTYNIHKIIISHVGTTYINSTFTININDINNALRNYLHLHCNRLIGGYPVIEESVIILLKRYTETMFHLHVDDHK